MASELFGPLVPAAVFLLKLLHAYQHCEFVHAFNTADLLFCVVLSSLAYITLGLARIANWKRHNGRRTEAEDFFKEVKRAVNAFCLIAAFALPIIAVHLSYANFKANVAEAKGRFADDEARQRRFRSTADWARLDPLNLCANDDKKRNAALIAYFRNDSVAFSLMHRSAAEYDLAFMFVWIGLFFVALSWTVRNM